MTLVVFSSNESAVLSTLRLSLAKASYSLLLGPDRQLAQEEGVVLFSCSLSTSLPKNFLNVSDALIFCDTPLSSPQWFTLYSLFPGNFLPHSRLFS